MFKSSLPIRLNCFLGMLVFRDLSPIDNVSSMLAQRLARDKPSAASQNQLWKYVEPAWTSVPQEYFQSSFDSMLTRVTAVIANNCGYTNY
ncbi:uncharacterized protein TNCV_1425661 [Trichonephila clavipes]|nr:uncharacterized protein TNCV_1425661 [Trichonephila clavipes]